VRGKGVAEMAKRVVTRYRRLGGSVGGNLRVTNGQDAAWQIARNTERTESTLWPVMGRLTRGLPPRRSDVPEWPAVPQRGRGQTWLV